MLRTSSTSGKLLDVSRDSLTAAGEPQVSVDTGGPAGNDPDEVRELKVAYLVEEHNLVCPWLDIEVPLP